MSRHRAQQEGQLWTALRAIQAICGFATLLSLFTAYKDITLSGVADDDTYRPAQLRHFFLAMAAYTSFGYGVLYLICVPLSGRLVPDVLLERLVDGVLAGVYLIVGILLAPKMNCGLGMYCTCTSVQAMVVFAFFNCALSVIAVGMSLVLKTLPAHPDSIENLVPRGHYGRAPSPAEGDAPRPRHKKKPSLRVDDDNTDNIAPRGKFGSVRGSNLADLMKLQRQDEPAPASTEHRVNYFV
ncbi:hypothetical protein SPRG_03085 [Saprolegnia parasitica CBS 223.65]|uniref:MARVEL domain-containing protein n=1 Tax=Saprolegnia parasitica (strain CBS 223.65) TaxID=695850 RepID=A0A067D1I0_SAPPC|nr:hypothetical protein SPRG_03085 [Saprolegnia parasitica CBS 223.65]KDO32611.1 hypothetical protein SPRG_03085 [Saprolegnia parasitica CBS 223.65]|eukprot:XP_012197053.1 hypothetical protein SPRG_03085 [Saprolegnia parasitica CBS 223.65]